MIKRRYLGGGREGQIGAMNLTSNSKSVLAVNEGSRILRKIRKEENVPKNSISKNTQVV